MEKDENSENSGGVKGEFLPNVKVVTPPPLESEGVTIEKLMDGCSPTFCSACVIISFHIRNSDNMLVNDRLVRAVSHPVEAPTLVDYVIRADTSSGASYHIAEQI